MTEQELQAKRDELAKVTQDAATLQREFIRINEEVLASIVQVACVLAG